MILEDRLNQLSVGADKVKMLSKWNIIKEDTEAKLKTVCGYFPHFSKHDVSHSIVIATHIGNLLGEERVNKLSYSDILIMLLCFYKHDIGMALEYEEVYKRFHEDSFNDTLKQYLDDKTSDLYNVAKRLKNFGGRFKDNDYESSIDVYNDVILLIEDIYRSDHAQRSAEAVMNDSFLGNAVHNRIKKIIADICAVHQKSIKEILKLEYKENGLFGDYFHPRFIAAMLCLGDLLDLDTDRFDEIMIKASTPFPHLSKLHLEKHKSVCHFLVIFNNIELCADTKTIEVYRIFRKWVDWMQEACDYIALHWSEIAPDDFGNPPRITKCDLLLNGNTKWLPFANTRYQISSKRMFELLQGSGIYRNKFVCIREIIQNAVDATLLRLFNEKELSGGDDSSVLKELKNINWNDYEISLLISKIDDSHVQVTIQDKGIGISTEDIKKIANVSNINSSSKNKLISKMPMWVRPSGAFGMGIQSIFLLTNQFEVVTKTADEPSKKITFQGMENSDGYITVEDYNDTFTQGTKVSFIIEGERLSADELNCSVYHYKRKKVSDFLMSKIYSEYDNKHESYPARYAQLKNTDYVPVKIELFDPARNIKERIEYKPFFVDDELNKIEVFDGKVKIKRFIPELNCHIICSIYLNNRHKKRESHTFGNISEAHKIHNYNNALFYRNTYVKDELISTHTYCNLPIISYCDWRINLLDTSADQVLQLNRNSFSASYAGILYKTVVKALEVVANESIDYLITNDCPEIGDTIILLYQFAVQLAPHKTDSIYDKYKDLFEKIKIKNYFQWGGKKVVSKGISELRKNPLYFIVNDVNCDNDICSTPLQQAECLALKTDSIASHILNHRINKIFLGEVNQQKVKVIEAVPFECNSKDSLYEIEEIFMLENIISMINFNARVLQATKGYEILVTPINPSATFLGHIFRNEQYYIEMPFVDFIKNMSEILHTDGYIEAAISKYYEKIIRSSIFSENVEYIADTNKKTKSDVEVKYQQLVRTCLELLQKSEYKEFNMSVLERTDEEKKKDLTYRDSIDLNPYTTRKIDLLE